MGVDFKTCTACSRTFPDCGPFDRCSEDSNGCGKNYCGPKCSKLREPELDPDTLDWVQFEALPEAEQAKYRMNCASCRKELASDENLLKYALELLGMDLEKLKDTFLAKAISPSAPIAQPASPR